MAASLTAEDLMLALRRMIPKVYESAAVPEGQVYVWNDLGRDVRRPEGWETMSVYEQLRWAVDNGMAVVVKNLG